MGLATVDAALGGPARAQETATYTYDTKGRVVAVQHTGGPSSGTNTAYTYDAADNRTNVNVSGSPNGNASNGAGDSASVGNTLYVVVPLNGFTLITINQ
jgi:YD repeat-containing protein